MFTVELTNQAGRTGDAISLFFTTKDAALQAGLAELDDHAIDRKLGDADQICGWAYGFKILDETGEMVFQLLRKA